MCGAAFAFRWTDAHGVGECTKCGAPYRIYHYGDDGKPVERPPELILPPEVVPQLRAFIAGGGRNPRLGPYFLAHPDISALQAFEAWLEARTKEARS